MTWILDIGYWLFALAYHLDERAIFAEAQFLVDADGFSVFLVHVEDDVEVLIQKLFHYAAGASSGVASAPMVGVSEDVAHRRQALGLEQGDTLLVAHRGDLLILKKLTLEDIIAETDRQYEAGETLGLEEAFKDLV